MFQQKLSVTFGFLTATLSLVFFLSIKASRCEAAGPGTTHTISITVMEVKGSTTVDRLSPPDIGPGSLSQGYGYKEPGAADKGDPGKWQVSSYLFSPSHISIKLRDKVNLTVFVTNGNEHDVILTDPDGNKIMDTSRWSRGREYKTSFVAKKTGLYRIICTTHSPTMTSTFYVLP